MDTIQAFSFAASVIILASFIGLLAHRIDKILDRLDRLEKAFEEGSE